MAILSKASKPDNFESHNSLKFSFSFKPVEVLVLFSLDVNLSLNQILLTFLLFLRQTLNFLKKILRSRFT